MKIVWILLIALINVAAFENEWNGWVTGGELGY